WEKIFIQKNKFKSMNFDIPDERRNKKLGLSGRKSRDVGILSTSKLYSLNDRVFAFTPQLTDLTRFYIASDYELMIDIFKSELNFLKSSWQNMLGRPLVVMAMKSIHLDGTEVSLQDRRPLDYGVVVVARVTLGNLNDFLSTSCITNLSFLGSLNPQVQSYLEEHLLKSLTPRSQLLTRSSVRKGNTLRRRMSVKGAIKKTRSIAVEPDILGMQGDERMERRQSVYFPPQALADAEADKISPRSPSPEDMVFHWKQNPTPRIRLTSETQQYADTEVEELLTMLRETEHLEEQGDILQYLVDTQGLEFNTGIVEDGKPVTVKDLLKVLYEKACQQKLWGIVRHTAGMLGKRVEDLAKAVTDLLVRQKQVTVGMPPTNEHTITAPLPEMELRQLIHQAYGDDESTAMLTQELIVYLAMFIRTEPQLFLEMLRLRVGLIIQVMATELSRTLILDIEKSIEGTQIKPHCKSSRVSKKSQIGSLLGADSDGAEDTEPDRQGQWLRRRRLDGALNRVPRDFYPRVWSVLERCRGLAIEGRVLPQNLTQEMTPGELKFALAVETVLNSIPQPEYRQLIVEALMVLTLVTEYNVAGSLGGIIPVENLVHKANQIFLEDQIKVNGDATLCCAKPKEHREMTSSGGLLCGGAAYVCQHFYDSAPSGSYGTMTYITRAVASLLDCLPRDGEMDCSIS
ncbi:hypothetical protein L9F63_012000, partial [Diploptera punctata]